MRSLSVQKANWQYITAKDKYIGDQAVCWIDTHAYSGSRSVMPELLRRVGWGDNPGRQPAQDVIFHLVCAFSLLQGDCGATRYHECYEGSRLQKGQGGNGGLL